MKMYILIKETTPPGKAIVSAAHASLVAYLKYRHDKDMLEWVNGIFYKTVCLVSENEFEKAKEYEKHVVLTESSLGNAEIAIAFCPRAEWPQFFKFLRLYK
jgi:hypothetical protein